LNFQSGFDMICCMNTNIDGQLSGAIVSIAPRFSPLYQQIKVLLTSALKEGAWRPGEVIPSEVELARRYQVSQGTVRKAIDELAAENLLVRRQGRGTYVASHQEPKAQFRFLRLRPNDGGISVPKSRLVDCKKMRAPVEVARSLRLKNTDSCVLVRRLLDFNDHPEVLDELWLPSLAFKGLTAERIEQFNGPLYGLFEAEFGIRMIRAEERIFAQKIGDIEAALLDLAVGSPVLVVDRTSYTYEGAAVEFRRGFYKTESFHYFNEII
jgi:GntR family transcriptional regulator